MAGSRVLALIAVIYCNPTENFHEVPSLAPAKSRACKDCVSQIQCRILFIFKYTQYRKWNFLEKQNKNQTWNPAHAGVSKNFALHLPGLGFHSEDFTAYFHL